MFGFGQTVDADKGNFSLFGVFVQGFADQCLISFDVENVVGNLEGDTDTARVVNQRLIFFALRVAQNGAGFAGVTEQASVFRVRRGF